jgi:hypothetical protein
LACGIDARRALGSLALLAKLLLALDSGRHLQPPSARPVRQV